LFSSNREKEKELIKKKLKAAKQVKKSKGVEDMIEAQPVLRKPPPGGGPPKNIKGSKVMPGNDTLEESFMFDDEGQQDPRAIKAKGGMKALGSGGDGGGPPGGGKGGFSSKVLPGDAGPGELLAAKNAESGFKQRKVNKRMKAYEEGAEEKDQGDGGEAGKKDS
jgi:hypothetical protein